MQPIRATRLRGVLLRRFLQEKGGVVEWARLRRLGEAGKGGLELFLDSEAYPVEQY